MSTAAVPLQSEEIELKASHGYGEVHFTTPSLVATPGFYFEPLEGSLGLAILSSVSIGGFEQLTRSFPADWFTDTRELALPSMGHGVTLRLCFGNTGPAVRFRVWFGPRQELADQKGSTRS